MRRRCLAIDSLGASRYDLGVVWKSDGSGTLSYWSTISLVFHRLAEGAGWRTALALSLIALGVQAVFLWETADSLLFRYPLVDAATCLSQAQSIASGSGMPGAYWQAPGYPYALALLVRVCGGASVLALRAAQALLLAPLLSVLTWRLGRHLLPATWAFAAGVATAWVGPLLFYASQFLPAYPAALLVTAALLAALGAAERPAGWRWLLAGALAGLGTVTVATVSAVWPVLMAVAWRSSPAGRNRLRYGLALALGAALPLLPVTLHNVLETGRWVWLSTNGDINFYIGNSRGWEQSLTAMPGLDWDQLARRPYEKGGAGSEAEAERWFRREALRDMWSEPGRAASTLALKAAAFWHGRELPRNIDLYGWRGASRLLRAAVWRRGVCFPTGLIVPLACVGALALLRRREGFLVAGSVLCFGLLVALFFPCSRYRVPVLPALVVLAAAGLHAWVLALRGRRWGKAAALGLAACAAGVLANGPLSWPTDRVRYDARLLNAIGASADVWGRDLATAQACHEGSLLLDPDDADAHFDLGTVCERRGDKLRAEACYRDALASRPDHDKAHVNLALLLFGQGKLKESLEHLTQAEALNPRNANAWHNHAAILLQVGHRHEAAEALRRAADLDPRYRAKYQLLLQALGK